jgi:cytoskeleton protein RodZ
MAYDLADLQSRIPFAVRRTWETGLPSFGEKLRVEREKRKITLEQISASTKIGTRMLQSLEEDKFNQLPGGIFNKGFVRAYSRCLGLDEDQAVADYLQASGDAPPVSTEIVAREDADRESAENIRRLEAVSDAPVRSLPWGLFAALLLIVALALSFWSYHRRDNTKPPIQSTATPSMTAPAAAQTQTQKVGAVSTASPNLGGSAIQNLAATATTGFTVVIHAREESWISITTDGKGLPSEILPAGTERSIQGRKEVIVKVGNAGGVDLRFNGQKVGTRGEFGEVKTVTFGPQGIVPSAPEPASVP